MSTAKEDSIRALQATEYAERIMHTCDGNFPLLADQVAALIGMLECAAKGALKVGNDDLATFATKGAALLREASLHLPVRSDFLLHILAGEPLPPLSLDIFQTLFAD